MFGRLDSTIRYNRRNVKGDELSSVSTLEEKQTDFSQRRVYGREKEQENCAMKLNKNWAWNGE